MVSIFQKLYGSYEIKPLVKPSARTIKEQAALFKASKVGKEWAESTECIYRAKGCSHWVLPFYSKENELVPQVFFKRGKNQGSIESIVWDIAVIFGWEDLFAATKLETVNIRKVGCLHKNKTKIKPINNLWKGSIQKAITGKLLHRWEGSPPINRLSLCRSFAAMFILGLNDVHGNNMFIQDDGTIKLFDNGKCLPAGNRFIVAGEHLYPVHRFSPLNLKDSKIPLDDAEIDAMKQMVESCTSGWIALEKYFSFPLKIKITSKLPDHWLDVNASLEAMRERVEILKKSLDSAKGNSLEDLMITVYPEYKFAFVLSMLEVMKGDQEMTESVDAALACFHSAVGGISLFEAFIKCHELNLDLVTIYRKSQDPSITLRQLIASCLLPMPEFFLKELDDVESVLEFLRLRKWLHVTFNDIPRDHKSCHIRKSEYEELNSLLNIIAEGFLYYRGFKKVVKGSKASLEQQKHKPKCSLLFYPEDENMEYAVFKDGSYRSLKSMDVTLTETSSLDLEPS